MATNLRNNTNTGRGENKGRKVHFDGNLILKQRESGLCGSAWRKQQKEQRRQKKMEQEGAAAARELKEMQQLTYAYYVLKSDCFESRLLEKVAASNRFARYLGSFLTAAGASAEESVTVKEKLQWFRNKHGNRVLEEAFLEKNYVRETLYYLCRTTEFRNGQCFVSVPDASSSESERLPLVEFSAEQRRVLEQAQHACGQIVVTERPYAFAGSSLSGNSGDSSTARANATNTSSAAAPHAATTTVYATHAVSGNVGVFKAAKSAPASKTAALESVVDSENAKSGSSSFTQIQVVDDTKKRAATESSSDSDVAEGSAKKNTRQMTLSYQVRSNLNNSTRRTQS
jgi:hypothetical protein